MQVPKVSPTPARPPNVSLSAPNSSPTLQANMTSNEIKHIQTTAYHDFFVHCCLRTYSKCHNGGTISLRITVVEAISQ